MSEQPASSSGKQTDRSQPCGNLRRTNQSTTSSGTRPGSELFPVGSGTRLAVILWDALSSLSVFFATSQEKKKRILTQRRKDAKKSKTIKQKIFENLGRASNNPDHALEFVRTGRIRFPEYYHGTHGATQNKKKLLLTLFVHSVHSVVKIFSSPMLFF